MSKQLEKTTKQPRPEFVAWEKLVEAQMQSNRNAIACLEAEIQAHKNLLMVQKIMLATAQKDEDAR